MGDAQRVVALGERECSIQRRHQKIIEESPAPGLSDATRARMIEAAIRLARAVGYRSAGTVEFLVEGDNFYFLEANTRLQVEHPVTEMRFGCDLVAEQIRVASGGRVEEPPVPRGAAIECRVYAEDAARDFRPAIGRVEHLNLPAGPGVRVDTHLGPGATVSPYYDGMLAKIISLGETREEARRRMVLALDEFSLLGVTNTAAFLRDVIDSEPFASARLTTGFLPNFFSRWRPAEDCLEAALIAAALNGGGAFGAASRGSPESAPACAARSPWDDLKGFNLWSRR